MASKHLSLFRIEAVEVADVHWTAYDYQVDLDATVHDPKVVIEESMRTGRLPGGGHRPHRGRQAARYLDIRESRTGHCTYVFHLDAVVGREPRLKFAPGEPFHPLPLNSVDGEVFLTDFRAEYGSEGLWASFSCDLTAVRDSRLARRIMQKTEKHAHEHEGQVAEPEHASALTIPFCLNVVDPELGASPWVVPRHSHGLEEIAVHLLTHGGVHPTDVAFLTVDL